MEVLDDQLVKSRRYQMIMSICECVRCVMIIAADSQLLVRGFDSRTETNIGCRPGPLSNANFAMLRFT